MATKPRAYVETTIPSFHCELRTSADAVARRDWTRQWWDIARNSYELVTSEAVLDELTSGIAERSAERLELVKNLPLLPMNLPVAEITTAYISHKVMPADPCG